LIPQALIRWDTHDAADAAAGAHPSLNLTSRPPKPLSSRPRGVAACSLDAEVMMAARPAGAEICPAERRHVRHQARASRHSERRGVRRGRSSYAATRGERGVDGVSFFGDPPRTAVRHGFLAAPRALREKESRLTPSRRTLAGESHLQCEVTDKQRQHQRGRHRLHCTTPGPCGCSSLRPPFHVLSWMSERH
jgi:hypothetical protein